MAIGQRIKYFRNRKGMTQKQLGEQLGFMGKTSDVRMAQYESEARVPKIDLEPNVVLFKHICSAKRSDLKHLLVHMMHSVFTHKTIRLVIYHHKAVEALLIPCPHSRIILIQLFVLHTPNTDIRIYRHKRICG